MVIPVVASILRSWVSVAAARSAMVARSPGCGRVARDARAPTDGGRPFSGDGGAPSGPGLGWISHRFGDEPCVIGRGWQVEGSPRGDVPRRGGPGVPPEVADHVRLVRPAEV